MKKSISLLIIFISLWSCSNKQANIEEVLESNDMERLREMKSQLSQQQMQIKDDLNKINQKLQKLDTTDQGTLVTTLQLNDTLFKHYLEIQGDVDTDKNIVIYPEYSGILKTISVKEGDQVRAGQILARIDDGGLSSQLAQIETQLSLAKTTFERQERLWKQKIGSEIQFLEAKSNFESVQNSAKQLRAQLAKTIVRAPFSGTIDQVIADEGQVVNPGQNALFRLVNLNEMYITAEVPESYLGKINKGTEVQIQFAALDKSIAGSIDQVANYINPNNRSFEVKINLPAKTQGIKPNQIATLKINDYTAQNAIVIPQSILQENAAGEHIAYAFKPTEKNKGIAHKRKVKTGLTYDNKIEIKAGLKAGEIIIIEGARSMRDQQKVKTKA
ncbi:efflux RND transporter periplasmic adaptor subunit [Mesonia sp. HuA40]|uniref:efflux RND transporter periplasmic adaptor subunit n=1 Tax=Mesonia sp. HuA40 TaxID=2602761 RepID=UPI0011C7090F|nr:efflux RND transporter periplasmic adaptor subunit [Mesonia sp. HuA40]TXK71509.1 efflux RND transporter periplasmic adaptor subunit [Mesonia sp. HuA40]